MVFVIVFILDFDFVRVIIDNDFRMWGGVITKVGLGDFLLIRALGFFRKFWVLF